MDPASRSANQTKTEPFPASPSESEGETAGAEDPQSASAASGVTPVPLGESAPGTSEQLPVVQGVHVPDVDESDPRT